MTLLYTNPCYLDHKTGSHPENGSRLEAIHQHLQQSRLETLCARPACPPVTLDRLARVHTPVYAEVIKEICEEGGGRIDADTIVSRRSYDTALRAAGAVCDAVDRVLGGESKTALCLVRPPGHHALTQESMGFCLFNNIAVAARVALKEYDLNSVLIVDFDIHHGNGTQHTFWEDPQVGFFSSHRFPFYPGTGSEDETGSGRGLGMTANLPLEYGTPRCKQLDLFASRLEAFAAKIKPELVLVSAGFDSHREDPVGCLDLESEDFVELTKVCLNIAQEHAGGKMISVLEGGYNPQVLAECVGLHLQTMLSFDS